MSPTTLKTKSPLTTTDSTTTTIDSTTTKDDDSSSVSADETIKGPKKSFDTASISTVSTIGYQGNVVTVVDVHRYTDKNVDRTEIERQEFGQSPPPIIDISFVDKRRRGSDKFNDDESSIMSEDGTTENYSDEERHNSILSIPSSINRFGGCSLIM